MGFDGPIALDYAAIKIVADAMDHPFDDTTINLLQMMEQRVLKELRDGRERQDKN